MSRGKTQKHETPQSLTLLRPMITRRFALVVDHEKCCGCTICELLCPPQAIKLGQAALNEGRVTQQPRVDIDAQRCNFCGECEVMCPTRAIALTVNEKPFLPAVEGKAFPLLIRKNVVDQAACAASTDVDYIEDCPVGAISATVERDAQGQVRAVSEVTVNKESCIHCTRCMEEGPTGAFTVTKPYRGKAVLRAELCPAGCQACADVCPSRAITYDGQRVWLDTRFCLFCSACEVVCPAEGAIRIVRTGFEHTPIESGAWVAAMDKLVSFREAIRELDVKGQQKRRKLVLEGLLLRSDSDGEEHS
jgi:4Fe-4S ferredoxin